MHTPEFPFEHDLGNVRRAAAEIGVGYPIAIDNDYAIWRAFKNEYWPALYFIDAKGRIRHHQFGEGDYDQAQSAIVQLLAEAGHAGAVTRAVPVDARGVEAAADWSSLKTPETYLGSDRAKTSRRPAVPHLGGPATTWLRHSYGSILGRFAGIGPSSLNRPSSTARPAVSSIVSMRAICISSWVRPCPGSRCGFGC